MDDYKQMEKSDRDRIDDALMIYQYQSYRENAKFSQCMKNFMVAEAFDNFKHARGYIDLVIRTAGVLGETDEQVRTQLAPQISIMQDSQQTLIDIYMTSDYPVIDEIVEICAMDLTGWPLDI